MPLKQVFVAATRQNDGKTMVSLGLLNAFKTRFKDVTYMKPVGQQFKLVDGKKIDKDAVLFSKIYDLKDPLPLMSPVAIPSGFTEEYIENPNRSQLESAILDSYKTLTLDKKFILLEGTGHAGVGSVIDMSNGDVANLLGTKVILVSLGGVGRCIDEIMLNKAVFELMGVELAGVIINKVREDKYDKVDRLVRKSLSEKGIPVLGVIPFVQMLNKPSVAEIRDALDLPLISGASREYNIVEKIVIGDMPPSDALDAFSMNTLLIVPASREELLMTALYGNALKGELSYWISGIIFTNGTKPHEKIMDLLKSNDIPVMSSEEDSFTITQRINNMIVKIRSKESDKIKMAQHLVETYVDMDQLIERISC